MALRLVREEGIKPKQIAVLTATEAQAERLRASPHLRSFLPSAAGDTNPVGMQISGVRRFKGLDSAVVILVIQDAHLPDAEILYVGLTRARTLLYVLAGKDVVRSLTTQRNVADPITV